MEYYSDIILYDIRRYSLLVESINLCTLRNLLAVTRGCKLKENIFSTWVKNLIFATHWTKSCGPRFATGWNGDDRYAARYHAKRWRKSDESSQIKSCFCCKISLKFRNSSVSANMKCAYYCTLEFGLVNFPMVFWFAGLSSHGDGSFGHDLLVYFIVSIYICGGTRWRSRLRHCATSRKVAVSISVGVIAIFH
jgi:hypothetical protein